MVEGVKLPTAEEASRQLRQEILEQKQNAHRNKEILCDINSNRLDEAVKRLDQVREKGEALGDHIQRSKDVSAQAEILRTLAGYGVEAANKLVQQQQGRGTVEFVRALRAAFVHTADPQRDGKEDPTVFCWAELAAATEHLRWPARGPHCMLGPLDAKPKERKAPVQRQKREAPAELVKPKEMDNIQEQDKQDTDRNMEAMWDVIKAQPEPVVPFVELVCNPRSFAQTVENAFTLSFLVKDNRVRLLHNPDLGLCVAPLEGRRADKPAAGAAGGSTGTTTVRQFFLKLQMRDWEDMCKIVKPESALMPHRDSRTKQIARNKKQRRD